jgi:hypothetical protein
VRKSAFPPVQGLVRIDGLGEGLHASAGSAGGSSEEESH